jgi:hypothetical protein
MHGAPMAAAIPARAPGFRDRGGGRDERGPGRGQRAGARSPRPSPRKEPTSVGGFAVSTPLCQLRALALPIRLCVLADASARAATEA